LYKLRLDDGDIMIARRCRATSAPIVYGDAVFFTCRVERDDGNALAECVTKIDQKLGKPLYTNQACPAEYLAPTKKEPSQSAQLRGADWTVEGRGLRELQEYSGSRLLAVDGRLFNCMGPEFRCTDAETAEHRWSFFVASAGHDRAEVAAGPAVLAGGKLFVATLAGELLQVDPQNGAIDRRVQLRAPVITEPIIDRGRVFLGTRDGRLLCVNLGDEKITGWNQWGGSASRSGPSGVGPSSRHLVRIR
jgi:outer membrane protein assembly factor BamB